MIQPTDVIGGLGATLSFALFIPQVIRTWTNRHHPERMAGLSVWTQALLLANATLWWVYAAILGEFWVGAPSFVNAPLAAITIFLIIRGRALAARTSGCAACAADVAHQVFVAALPGWGDVATCSATTRTLGITVYNGHTGPELRPARVG